MNQELIYCSNSFKHFFQYCRVNEETLTLYAYQNRLINFYESNDKVIGIKFRQGGFTTVTIAYAIWCCVFRPNQRFFVASRTDREAIHVGHIADRMLDQFPDWLSPFHLSGNQHVRRFSSGNWLRFGTLNQTRGLDYTHLVIDEAAFQDVKCLLPTPKCFAISTTNGVGNWFYDTYKKAEAGEGDFKIFEASYKEHPRFQHPDAINKLKELLGYRFRQEMLGEFVLQQSGDELLVDTLEELLDVLKKSIGPLEVAIKRLRS